MRDSIFTPAAMHDEAVRAHREGRHEHAQQYLTHIGNALQGTGLKAPTVDDIQSSSFESPGGVEGDDDSDYNAYLPKAEGSPVEVAWDNILKNLKPL